MITKKKKTNSFFFFFYLMSKHIQNIDKPNYKKYKQMPKGHISHEQFAPKTNITQIQ